jgi:hypothetical protein
MLIDIVKKINKFEPKIRDVLLDILDEIEEQKKYYEQTVTKIEFNDLRKIVKELAEAQQRTEKKVEELAEAQKKTEKKMEKLAEAQIKTEEVVRKLVKDMSEVKTKLEGLSDSVGYGLEDKLLPFMKFFIKNQYNYKVNVVDRRNIIYPDGKFDEINLYIEAEKDSKPVLIIGECKAKPGKKDIKKFLKLKERVAKYLNKEVKGFIVGYTYHPEVEKYLEKTKDIDWFKTFEIERIAEKSE